MIQGVQPSMGSVGDCFDMPESFFASLECELLARHRFKTQAEAKITVFEYIGRLVCRFWMTPWRDRFTSQSVATARPTSTKNTPRTLGFFFRCAAAISCFRSSWSQSMTGTPFVLAQLRTRRLKRPAIRIRCALSSWSSEPPCDRRHQLRKPPAE
ncbi:MAG: IS3 family transposase [Gammaproteobacteria bacterium]|nr:IS3 family transposase [Gammaproteobacteria bacterium]